MGMSKSKKDITSTPAKGFRYTGRTDLTPEEKRIENEVGRLFAENLPALIREYRRRFGHIIDRNNAQELYVPYAKNRESRQELSLATHEPAGALADEVYHTLVTKQAPADKNIVLFNAGGQGSGKTTSLRLSGKADRAFIVMDGTMQDFEKGCRNIDLAFQQGKLVHINFVYCPFRKAVEHIVRRASDVQGGRVVNIKRAAKGHFHALENIFKLTEKYGSRDGFTFTVVDNSEENPKPMTLEELRRKRYPRIDDLEREGYAVVDEVFATFRANDKSLTEGLHRRLKSN